MQCPKTIFFEKICDGGYRWAEDDMQSKVLNPDEEGVWEIHPKGTHLSDRTLLLHLLYDESMAGSPYLLSLGIGDSSERTISNLFYRYNTLPNSLEFEMTDYSIPDGHFSFTISCNASEK